MKTMPEKIAASIRSVRFVVCAIAVLAGIGASMFWWGQHDRSASAAPGSNVVSNLKSTVAPSTKTRAAIPAVSFAAAGGITTTSIDSRVDAPGLNVFGQVRLPSSDRTLSDALDHTGKMNLKDRLAVVHALSAEALTADQLKSLRDFVANPRRPERLGTRQVRALKNDILNVLVARVGDEVQTAGLLRSVYLDKTQDAALRDYALQHWATLAERVPALGWELHWRALETDEPALTATALLHLVNRSQRGELTPLESSALSTAALKLAADAAKKDTSRATALQVCARLSLSAARPIAVEIAESSRAGIPLRIAAIAALGDLGGEGVPDRLVAFKSGPEVRLHLPAQIALQKISKR